MKTTTPFLFLAWVLGSCFVSAQTLTPAGGDSSATTFRNPILAGDFPDPTIMRDGEDYYMTHSSMYYVPGLLVLHSRDLINWEPISNALDTYMNSVWAPDMCKHGDTFYIYFTVAGKGNFVVYADNPAGPWSEPVDLQLDGIDPGHVVDDAGQRWVFMNGGYRAQLNPDGLSVVDGTLEKVYDGWEFPIEWETDGFNLEGPKLKKIGDYFYLLAAQGGTAGPPTSHMITVARAKTIDGPWENAPNNPLVRTRADSEQWWAKGHGSLIDTPDGNWWVVYHAYENGFLGMGRQTLIEPVEIDDHGWLVAPAGTAIERPMTRPIPSGQPIDRLEHLNEFRIGYEWKFFKEYSPERVSVDNGTVTLQAFGPNPGASAPMLFVPGVHNYEISAKIDVDSAAVGGLTLFYKEDFYVGTGIDTEKRIRWRKGDVRGTWPRAENGHFWLKIRTVDHIVTGYYSYDGMEWIKEIWGMDISGYHHNTLYEFISVLPGFFAYGEGEVRFSDFKFEVLD
ncbi:family 43 glycosylhydrolase [Lewinella sp. IMCC34191]|uniref:family 43 glycosylhydrolase n=1 Tax=Lewinella sp. IMCC34191 TaxID=2259172 RepID=UPI000E251CD8|nr:family 43 glycosylhydrolase [Lewinella sp. IMCC34191]